VVEVLAPLREDVVLWRSEVVEGWRAGIPPDEAVVEKVFVLGVLRLAKAGFWGWV
jgi:hypothetical protein